VLGAEKSERGGMVRVKEAREKVWEKIREKVRVKVRQKKGGEREETGEK
jgi:hypothetical protein